MLNLRIIDKISMPLVTRFILDKLVIYNTESIEWIKLLPLNGRIPLHGCCDFPVRAGPRLRRFKSGYRLRASVNVEMAPPYIHQHWGRIPSKENKQGWYSGERTFVFHDLESSAVHTLAHECFHFLSHSKQVVHKNTEANANWWADQWLAEFHEYERAST